MLSETFERGTYRTKLLASSPVVDCPPGSPPVCQEQVVDSVQEILSADWLG